MILGLLLMAAALGLVLFNKWDSDRAGKESAQVLETLTEVIEENVEEYVSAAEDGEVRPPSMKAVYAEQRRIYPEMATEEVDGYLYIGVLDIPSLDISLPVMAEWDYDRLSIAPCRYEGSYYTDDLVICGHNYEKHFSPIKWIDIGAEVYFTTVEGETYRYTVSNRETVQPTAIEDMISGDDWDLTLFTCNTGGQTRCAVRCQRAE